jgi:hypothetical protein
LVSDDLLLVQLQFVSSAADVLGATACYFYMSSRKSSRPAGSTKEVAVADGERKYLIGGNWKCNGTLAECVDRIKVLHEAGPIPSNVEVAICAPYIHLPGLLASLRSDIAVGAQDCGINASKGAYTGEIAAFQVKDLGCPWTADASISLFLYLA